MSALEKRIERLEQVHGAVKSPTSVVQFVSPTLGLVGLRCGDFAIDRLDDETEVQFLVRSRRELAHVGP